MRARTGWIAGGAGLLLVIAAAGCGDDDDSGNSARDGGGDAAMHGGSGGSSSSGVTLPDGTTGKPCTANDDCGGGTCAMQLGGGLGGQAMMAPGGYCTLMCSDNMQCGSGGACIGGLGAMGGPATGQCMSQCLNDDDCRDGYVCGGGFSVGGISIPNTCSPKPHTDQLDDGVAGAMCGSDNDCKGGKCLTSRPGFLGNGGTMLPGGYCSGDCLKDADCGGGGVCLLPAFGMGAGSCYESCTSDSDCTRDGYRCRMLGNNVRGCDPAADPLPDGTAGKACAADADCGGAMGSCATELPGEGFAAFFQRWPAEGGYCSLSCMEDSDCGAGGVCLGFGAGTCFATCTTMTDCRDGYTCSDRGAMMGMNGGGMGRDGGMAMPAPTVCSPNPPPMMMDEDGGSMGRQDGGASM